VRTASVLAIAIGCLALIGWKFEITIFKSVIPGLAPIKANAGLAFIFAGVSLYLRTRVQGRKLSITNYQLPIAKICAAIVALIGLLTLVQYLFDWNLGIDRLLFSDSPISPETPYLGRMAENTATNFFLLGVALWLLPSQEARGTSRRENNSILVAQSLSLTATAIALLALIGYIYQVKVFYTSVIISTPMALHAALTFFILCTGILFVHPHRALMAVVTSELNGGAIARRLIPGAIAIPLVLGWLILQGYRLGLYNPAFAVALLVLLLILIYISLIWRNAVFLNGIDRDRQLTENALRQSEARLRLFVESDVIGILYGNVHGEISYANDACLDIIGYTRADLEAGRIDWIDLTPPEYLPLDEERIAEAQARGTCTPYEKEYIRKDGTRVFVIIGYTLLGENREQSIAFILDISDRKQAEAELQESEERFRHLTDTAPMMVWMSGTDKLCTYFNKSWLAFTGRTMAQELGNGWVEGVHTDDVQDCLDTYVRAFDARDNFQMEYRLKRFDGEYRWILDLGTPRFTAEGNFLGYIGSCIDITERKSAESEIAKLNQSLNRQIEKLETLVEVIPIGIGIAEDPECQKIRVNPSFAKQLGISPNLNASLSASADEKPTSFKVYCDGREMSAEELPMQYAAAHGVEIRDLEVDVVHADGRTVKLLEYAAPLFDEQGKTIGSVGAFIDITKRKQDEIQIRQLNETLEARVQQRTAQLEAANKELESFSYSVSHDLRAPLRHIAGFVDLLQKRLKSKTTLDETSQRYLNIIVETTQLAGKLIDDLLSFSRMGRTEMRCTTIDMNLLVHEVLRDLELETRNRQIAWQIQPLPRVQGDPSMLRLVLRNLVENALKYTKFKLPVEITIGSQIAAQEVVFFVRDNGIGFDMQYAHKLFGVFQRLHSDPNFQGTGVGLANVQRIIHRHGGRVWAEGEVGTGATFYFSLPRLGVRGGE
jgi:PAS domain S-box-containing protein